MALFSFSDPISLNLEDASIVYYPVFYSEKSADNLFQTVLNKTPWQQDLITVYGKTYNQPRLTAFYSNTKNALEYSNIKMDPHPFSDCLTSIKNKIEKEVNTEFNSCLLNLYRDGNDSNGWHADNEKQLGINPVIASLSLGAERFFHLKHKTKPHLKHKLILKHGSLLVMKEETQHFWLHQIPKTKKQIGKRINLTFRYIK
jgi:alkylated DNA repair dioxygenase AlkB